MTLGQGLSEKRRGGGVGAGDVLGGACGDDPAAVRAGLGADLEDPVGGFEDVEVVLDDHDAVAAVHDALEHLKESFHVMAVQAGGGLVEQEQGAY